MVKLAAPLEQAQNLTPPSERPPLLPLFRPLGVASLRKIQNEFSVKVKAPSAVPVPDGAYVATYSELDSFRQCPLKHHLGYTQRWSRDPGPGSALHVGSLFHEVMQHQYFLFAHYSSKQRVAKADELRAIVWADVWPLLHNEAGQQTDDQVLVQWLWEGHWARYGVEPTWEIVAVEKAGRLLLPPVAMDVGNYLQFKIDLCVLNLENNRLELIDHKTAKDFGRQAEIDIDDQFGLYTWALRQFGVDIFRSIRSDTRKQRNVGDIKGTKLMELDERFRRVPSFRTDVELANIALDAVGAIRAIRAGVRYSSPNPAQCSWKCDFREAHLMARKGFKVDAYLADTGFTQRDGKHREYSEQELSG